MQGNQAMPTDLISSVDASTSPAVYDNSGNGVQIINPNAPVNVTLDVAGLMHQLYGPVTNQAHAGEWSRLNTSYYCLFVLENEFYNSGAFSIAKDCALQAPYTTKGVKEKFRGLSSENIRELESMPCIFAMRNTNYKGENEHSSFYVGRIDDLVRQKNNIRFKFTIFGSFPQALLNQETKDFHIASAPMRNELDVEHWAIKECDLIGTFERMDLRIA